MAKRKIEAEVSLNTAQAQRRAKALTTEVGKVGGASAQSGDAGSKSFDKMGGSIAGVAAGVAGLIGLFAMAKKGADAAIQYVERLSAAGARLRESVRERVTQGAFEKFGDANMRISAMAGTSPAESYRAVRKLSGETMVAPGVAGMLMQQLYPALDMSDADKMKAITGTARTAFLEGMGTEAGDVAATLHQQFGMKTPEAMAGGMAQLRAGAKPSSFTMGQFGSILSRVAPTMNAAGVPFQRQVGMISGLSSAFRGQPENAGMALQMLSRVEFLEDKVTPRILRAAGLDPKKATLEQRLDAIRKWLNEPATDEGKSSRRRELATATGIDTRVFRTLQTSSTEAYSDLYNKTIAAMSGATAAQTDAEYAAKTSGADAGVVRGKYSGEAGAMSTGGPGSDDDVSAIRVAMRGKIGPRLKEEAARLGAKLSEMSGPLGRGAAPTDALERLVVLNRLYPGVYRSLRAVASTSDGKQLGGGSGYAIEADALADGLSKAHDEANTNDIVQILSNETYINRFGERMEASIEFLRRLEAGDRKAVHGLTGEALYGAPSDAERGAARPGGAAGDVWPSSGSVSGPQSSLPATTNIGVLYNVAPGTMANNTMTRIG